MEKLGVNIERLANLSIFANGKMKWKTYTKLGNFARKNWFLKRYGRGLFRNLIKYKILIMINKMLENKDV